MMFLLIFWYKQIVVLFDLCANKQITVFEFLQLDGRVSFNIWLPPVLFNQWLELVNKVYSFHFENTQDKIIWKWNGNGKFATNSVYDRISRCQPRGCFKHIWKSRLPYKIKIFTWLLENKVVLTRENMVRKKMAWQPCMFFLFSTWDSRSLVLPKTCGPSHLGVCGSQPGSK